MGKDTDDLIFDGRNFTQRPYSADEQRIAEALDFGGGADPVGWLIASARFGAHFVKELRAENARLRRCLLPVWMGMAEHDLVGEPLPDSAVVLSFMGSGASDRVTAGEIRAALTPEDAPREGESSETPSEGLKKSPEKKL